MSLELMQKHFGSMSILDDPAPLLVFGAILFMNLALTFIHSLQELKGRLWRYFGTIAGIRIPDWIGIPLFSVGLTLALWALGLIGIAGLVPAWADNPKAWASFAVGALIGGRIGDGIFSHVRLDRAGFRPNPGLKSVPLFFAEALVLLVMFSPGLVAEPFCAILGVATGFGFFWSVLPSLRLLRKIPGRRLAFKN